MSGTTTEALGEDRGLAIRDLRVRFATEQGTVRAVDGVSLTVGHGEAIGLVGESGCGKSVTALSILRLVPRPPGEITSGQVIYRGRDLLRLPERELRRVRGREIAMIFQEPMTALNPVLTIGEQIAEVYRVHLGLSRKEAWERAVQMLARVEIPSPEIRAKDYPHQFSGGMKQRAMIAMALACSPTLLIADEPTTALDVTIQAQILDLLMTLREETGMAILLITHDLAIVAETTDRVAVMYAGRIVEEAGTADLFRQPCHPYTRGLLRSLPHFGRRGGRLKSIPGTVPVFREAVGCNFADRCDVALPRCRQEEPPTVEVDTGHRVECWLYEGGAHA